MPTDSKSVISSSASVSMAIEAGMPGGASLGPDSMLESSVEVICNEVEVPDVGGVKPVWCDMLFFLLLIWREGRGTGRPPCGAATLPKYRVRRNEV